MPLLDQSSPVDKLTSMRIVVAPDSFKGSIAAGEAAAVISQAWLRVRPGDDVVLLPLADGGEGTLDALAAGHPQAQRRSCTVQGPLGDPVDAGWLLLPDGTAAVELAQAAGLPLLSAPDPLNASSYGLGEILRITTDDPQVRRIVVTLGGSATTDAAVGALSALGAVFTDADGRALGPGGGALNELAGIDLSGLLPAPAGGVTCLVDVDAPLIGPTGAAHQFGPQKGATAAEVDALERGLIRLAQVANAPTGVPGYGAAGGAAFGLATFWQATMASGARAIAELAGLDPALRGADLVITGEGSFDQQSFGGKVVGNVLERAAIFGVRVLVIAGRAAATLTAPDRVITLTELAPSVEAAITAPATWLCAAATIAASPAV
jgi:glycerate kinase